MNLPPHGKEIFTDRVRRILHGMVRSFLHGTVTRILQDNPISPACGELIKGGASDSSAVYLH